MIMLKEKLQYLKKKVRLHMMVGINMDIAKRMHEVARLQAAHLGHHHRQQGIGSNVERHAQEYVGTPLIQLAGEATIGHIELKERMARREGHTMSRRESGLRLICSTTLAS